MFDIREDDIEMIVRLLTAVASGACIGYERSFHGRPAGLRTHVLVCLASSLLMLVTVYEDHWVRSQGEEGEGIAQGGPPLWAVTMRPATVATIARGVITA